MPFNQCNHGHVRVVWRPGPVAATFHDVWSRFHMSGQTDFRHQETLSALRFRHRSERKQMTHIAGKNAALHDHRCHPELLLRPAQTQQMHEKGRHDVCGNHENDTLRRGVVILSLRCEHCHNGNRPKPRTLANPKIKLMALVQLSPRPRLHLGRSRLISH